jgi:hypothetical protein
MSLLFLAGWLLKSKSAASVPIYHRSIFKAWDALHGPGKRAEKVDIVHNTPLRRWQK